jgi:hypothetical protein
LSFACFALISLHSIFSLSRHLFCRADGSGCLIARVHHCIGDGLALVAAFSRLFTNVDGGAVPLMTLSPASKESTIGSEIRQASGSSMGAMVATWKTVTYLVHSL